jgi:hypothetical protein
MDSKRIGELNTHAENVAAKLGVAAAVRLVTMERSDDVSSGETQIELTDFRQIAGRIQERSERFRLERPNLEAVIEEQLAVLASQLNDTV